MDAQKPVLLTGIKPTGDLHIGNYFGAMKPLVDLAKSGKYRVFAMIADYHALNTMQDAEGMRASSRALASGLLAAGLDPNDVVLFKQSAVSQHTELAWIFDAITTMPYLGRSHAFKAAVDRQRTETPPAGNLTYTVAGQLPDISVGTFNYPMLMAADILLYDAAVVPVGQDQKQHIEYARDTAEKFNRTFKADVFTLPEPYTMPEVAVVPGIDGQKMSKSYGNVIPLFGSPEEVQKKVMSIVTDSSGERPENVYAIHKLIKTETELAPLYEANKGSYKALKEALSADLEAFLAPMRVRYQELQSDPNTLEEALEKGAKAARGVAEAKMHLARQAIGVA